jgi:hypothetical protein
VGKIHARCDQLDCWTVDESSWQLVKFSCTLDALDLVLFFNVSIKMFGIFFEIFASFFHISYIMCDFNRSSFEELKVHVVPKYSHIYWTLP